MTPCGRFAHRTAGAAASQTRQTADAVWSATSLAFDSRWGKETAASLEPFSKLKRIADTDLLIIVNEKAAVAVNRELERILLDNILGWNGRLLRIKGGGMGDIRNRDDARTLYKHKMNIHSKQHQIVQNAPQLREGALDRRDGNQR